MGTTQIPYADKSWNLTVGCTHSGMRGCDNCWAKDLHDMRHKAYLAGKKVPLQYAKPFSEIQLRYDRLEDPLHWRKQCRIFVCSMSDIFHPLVPESYIYKALLITQRANWHTYMIFTKQVKRMKMLLDKFYGTSNGIKWPFENVCLIVSCSTQKELDENVPILLDITAAIRGVSLEPLIERVDFYDSLIPDLVIVGCESGPKRRPCKLEWIENAVRHCDEPNVSVYVKQLEINGKVSKNPKEWPKWAQRQEYPIFMCRWQITSKVLK